MIAMKRPSSCVGGVSKEAVVLLMGLSAALLVVIGLMSGGDFSQAQCSRMIQQSVELSYGRFEGLMGILSNARDSGVRIGVQRNELSRQLNEMKKVVGQMSCQEIEFRLKLGEHMSSHAVSTNGGWCSKDSSPDSKQHHFDKAFAMGLESLLQGKRVASFGEGPGAYKAYFDQTETLSSYTGYDGAPFCEDTTKGQVMFLDLTAPQYGLPAFDWVVSVEVGEHIPAKYESVFVDNLVRHAREGMVLSWATPGQDGLSHVNLKSMEDLISLMNAHGFVVDNTEGEKLRNAAQTSWLQRNLQVFRRKDPSSFQIENV